MTKYFKYDGQMYKATLWIASKTMGFSVVEWPDFEWTPWGCIQVKPVYHKEFKIQKIQNIDHYIDQWIELQREWKNTDESH